MAKQIKIIIDFGDIAKIRVNSIIRVGVKIRSSLRSLELLGALPVLFLVELD
jgi:hypothetical protein